MTGFCSNLCSCYTCSPLRTFWGLPPPWDALSPKAPAACLHPCVRAVSLWSNSADPCTAPSLSHLTCCHHAHLFTWETHDLPEGFVPNSHAACDIDVKWWDLVVFPKNLWTEVGFGISANDQTNLKILPFIVMVELKYSTVCYIRKFFFFFLPNLVYIRFLGCHLKHRQHLLERYWHPRQLQDLEDPNWRRGRTSGALGATETEAKLRP